LRSSVVETDKGPNEPKQKLAIKKVTNVFSKKILAKRALREIKLLQHFRGHRNVCHPSELLLGDRQLTWIDYLSVRYGYSST